MADYNINAVTRRVVYTGSAGLGPYAFSFEVLVNTDVAVYFNSTLLTLTTDYTVLINANGTGSITIVTGTNVPTTPDSGDQITVVGDRAIERTTDFVTAGDLRASSLNEQLDALTIFDQQLAESADRAVKAPITDPTSIDMTLPVKATRATKALGFDSAGDPVVSTQTLAQIEAGSTDAAASAAAAVVSADAAAASAAAAATSYDNFDDRYLGQKSSDPSVDNDGGSLITGALYFNTSNNVMMVYTGSAWVRTTPTTGDQANIDAVTANATNINTVAGVAANVTTVAGISADVTTVAADGTDIGTVAGISANVTTVAGVAADVTTTAGISADVTTVAADGADIGTVAGISANVTSVAGVASNVTTVAGVASNVTTVAGIAANVTTTAGISGDVTTVAGISGDVSAVAAQVIGYDFSTTTAMADPGAGNVRFNNATLASVSQIAIDDLDKNGVDQSAFIILWDDSTNTVKGTLVFRTAGGDVATFLITGLTDNAGWSQVAVTHVASSGTFGNGEDTFIGFTRAGDKGADGEGAGDVIGPASATDNAVARYDNTTGKLIQGSGVTIDDSNLLTVPGGLAVNKGGDIASASPLVIDTDGGYFDVTGTTGFSAITVAANRLFTLQWDGIVTVTHGAALVLPGGANLTTAAGDVWTCYSTAANTVVVTNVATASPSGGGGLYRGNNGTTGTSSGDIFRINATTLTLDEAIESGENASAAGPLSIASGITLTINGALVIL